MDSSEKGNTICTLYLFEDEATFISYPRLLVDHNVQSNNASYTFHRKGRPITSIRSSKAETNTHNSVNIHGDSWLTSDALDLVPITSLASQLSSP